MSCHSHEKRGPQPTPGIPPQLIKLTTDKPLRALRQQAMVPWLLPKGTLYEFFFFFKIPELTLCPGTPNEN